MSQPIGQKIVIRCPDCKGKTRDKPILYVYKAKMAGDHLKVLRLDDGDEDFTGGTGVCSSCGNVFATKKNGQWELKKTYPR